MGEADTQDTARFQQAHALYRLDRIIVPRPDKDVLSRECLGEALRMMAVKREGDGRHPAMHAIVTGDTADRQALETGKARNQPPAKFMFPCRQAVEGAVNGGGAMYPKLGG